MPTLGRAAVAHEFGKPLRIEEISFADPEPEEILVRIHATGVCHTDLYAVNGEWPIKPSLPFIPGHEGVGIITKAGREVHNVKEGDRVGLPWLRSTCGECEWCLSGWETLCPQARYGGYTTNGSFADYVVAPAHYAAHIPRRLSDVEAAPILCAGVTTWKALKETEAQPGQWVAISGIGGLGQLAIQYAVAMGMHVIAIDINPYKLTRAKDFGAEIVIDAGDPAQVESIHSLLGGAHAVVVTASSLSAFRQAIGILRRKGTCVLVGLPPGEFPLPLFDVVLKRLTVRGSLAGTRFDMEEAMAIAAEGRAHSELHTQPFETVNTALHHLCVGDIEGRIVLTM